MVVKNRAFYILLDIAALIVAFLLAAITREPVLRGKPIQELWLVCILMIFFYLLVILFYQAKRPLMKRNSWNEFRIVLTINFQVALLSAIFLYLLHISNQMPRSFYIVFFIYNTVWMYAGRIILKYMVLLYYESLGNRRRLFICANKSNILKVMNKFLASNLYEYEVTAFMLVDDSRELGERMEIYRILYDGGHSKMVKCEESLEEFLRCGVIDEALLSLPESDREELDLFIARLETMGILTNVTINTFIQGGREKAVKDFGVYHVLAYSPRIFEPNELMLKRAMDIIGGFAGVIFTVLLGIFTVPAICLESPGPPVFKQTRIGKNGRRFSIYKFRSMYQDAEDRKTELEAHNQMGGLMFKMKNDPRITRVGKFIRRTSIDEFPQFFNVLKGDMSLVGTRPPTEKEFLQYEEHHKRRLSLKPGLTGLWQVRGRSTVTDFEEVVSMDVEYIDNWSVWQDIRIIFETVLVVVKGTGAE